MTDHKTDGNRWRWYILLAIALILISATIVFNWLLLQDHAWDARGSFGDMFGIANAIFSGLAFALLILTVLMQKEELGLQRQELRDTRQELARTAEAQEKSEKALNDQLEELIKQRRLSVMPAFTLEILLPKEGDSRLHNIGNGTALNVRIHTEQWTLININAPATPIFYSHNHVPNGASRPCTISNLKEGRDGHRLSVANDHLRGGDYELHMEFQDIEGTAYKQTLRIDKGICVPLPVERVDLATK